MTKNEETVLDRTTNRSFLQKKILEPFIHQVSGRAHMLTFDANTLCKSLSKREWNFYNMLPTSFRNFAPRLKGLVFVHLVHENCSSYKFVSSDVCLPIQKCDYKPLPNGNTSLSNNILTNVGKEKDCCWNHTFKQTLFKGLERVEYNLIDGFTDHAWTIDKDQEAETEALGRNPWSLRQHRREINRTLKGDVLRKEVNVNELCLEIGLRNHVGQMSSDHYVKAYLLLEDVTHNYQFPSILDLKIGTQLDRDGCSQAKKDKHLNLVQKSSTGSLGLRLAGMQVYQVTTKQYLCRDKYYGRGLSTKGFIDALAQFLHNGNRTIVEVIPPIVTRLKELRNELEKQETFRFYASSVLIVYESVNQIDNLEKQSQNSINTNNLQEHEIVNYSANEDGSARLSNCKFSVHMIDFAHSTFQGFLEDKRIYEGPDKDCLHALDNLVTVLDSILKNAKSTT